MEPYTHGATVAGVSSALAAGWIRSRVRDEYSPQVEPPSIKSRLQRRAPLAVAGLGFAGLSAAISYRFDSYESELLNDESIPLNGAHRDLHSIPILGSAYGAARLIKFAAAKIGESTAGYLNLSEQSEAIINAMESMADWVLDSSVFGSLGHFAGDLPTKGDRGFAALRLLKPFSQRNFSFGWVKYDGAPWNGYLQTAGLAVAGAAWSVSGLYILSWQPPEDQLTEYIEEVGSCENYAAVKSQVLGDIEKLFTRILDLTERTFWGLPLFESAPADIKTAPENHWYRMGYNLEEILDIGTADYETLVDMDILPQISAYPDDGVPLRQSQAELRADEVSLLDEPDTNVDSLSSDSQSKSTDSLDSEIADESEGLSRSGDDGISIADSEQKDEVSSIGSDDKRSSSED